MKPLPGNHILPVIHLNGTSADELIRVRSEAYDALGVAYEALRQMSPNGRDYYPIDANAISIAVEQHRKRQQAIDDIRNELECEIWFIEQEQKARVRR